MRNTNKIIQDYRDGKSLTQIAKEENLSRRKITKIIKDFGEPIVNRHNLLKFNENFFDSIDTEEKAYWLGFIYADGCIMQNTYSFELGLSTQDEGHIIKFIKDIAFTGKIYYKKNSISCCLRSKHFWTILNSYGCVPKKSLKLVFPNENIFKDKTLIRHFIRGYFDGDGCISQYVHQTIVSPHIEVIGTKLFLQEILKHSKCDAKFKHDNRHSENTFSLEFTKQNGIDFINYLYQNCSIYLDRKFQKFNFFKNGSRSIQEWIEFNESKTVNVCDDNAVVNVEIKESTSPYSVEIEPAIAE